MAKSVDKIAEEIRELPDVEKLRLVDTILSDLDKPDPEIDRVWAEEARKRWVAYKAGRYLRSLMSQRCSSRTFALPTSLLDPSESKFVIMIAGVT